MTPVRRLQTGHHTVVVEVADNLCGHSPLCQLGNERQIGDGLQRFNSVLLHDTLPVDLPDL